MSRGTLNDDQHGLKLCGMLFSISFRLEVVIQAGLRTTRRRTSDRCAPTRGWAAAAEDGLAADPGREAAATVAAPG